MHVGSSELYGKAEPRAFGYNGAVLEFPTKAFWSFASARPKACVACRQQLRSGLAFVIIIPSSSSPQMRRPILRSKSGLSMLRRRAAALRQGTKASHALSTVWVEVHSTACSASGILNA
jgi:hypothetical protein